MMSEQKQRLNNPRRKLVEEVADWLRSHMRKDDAGADSLAHVCVVVPTAQSGRNLRLALAKRFPNGMVSPMVVQPMRLVVPADDSLQEATDAEVAALFLKFVESRPRHHVEDGKCVVEEWTHLFRPESFGDHDALFSFLDQLSDIWRVLGARGLLMGDVREVDAARKVLEEACGDESVRWDELAELEEAFFAFLHGHGLRHRAESLHLAKTAPSALPEEIEEVVLPALADPVPVLYDVLENQRESLKVTVLLHCDEADMDKFDKWGCPQVNCWTGNARPEIGRRISNDGQNQEDVFTEDDIFRAPNFSALAGELVKDFPEAKSKLALPSLALCDSSAFPEISAAFLNSGYVIHNPESHRLSDSSLGRLVRALFNAWKVSSAGLPWDTFVSIFRADDVTSALKKSGVVEKRTETLEGLDIFQNKYLPTFMPEKLDFPPEVLDPKREKPKVDAFLEDAKAVLALLGEARKKETLAEFARHFLMGVFKFKRLRDTTQDNGRADNPRERESEEEFRAAADCVWRLLDSLSSKTVGECGLSDNDIVALARRLLGASTYSLEPESHDAVKTEGWLELAWSECDKLALAGFHEGAVPDSIIGHAFLPDKLRAALGLTSNAGRLARDTWLFKELVDSHAPHAIHAYIASANDAGDICRPSRLLFLCGQAELAGRVESLFGKTGTPDVTPPRIAPKGDWRLKLPDEVPLPNGRLSSSAIDAYLESPFKYLLQYGMGMRKYEDKRELGYDDFGTLVHAVLEAYAHEQFEKGVNGQLSDAEAIRRRLLEIMDEKFAVFGGHPTTNVRLQLESLRDRLSDFATVQENWAKDGWRVAVEPEYGFEVAPFDGLDVKIKGSVDRIDGRVGADGKMEYRIIDYKTWDDVGDASKHIQTSSEEQIVFADKLKLPTEECDRGCGKRRMLTTQLPLYGKCLEKKDPEKFLNKGGIVDYCYLVLGADAKNVKPYGSRESSRNSICIADLVDLSLKTAETAIRRIQANIFLPLVPSKKTKLYDYGDLVMRSPELDQGDGADESDWLKKQKQKLGGL